MPDRIPRPALILGIGGLIPFVWGALTVLSADLAAFSFRTLGPRFLGPYVMLSYGTIILAFMSGVLWGFSTRATGEAAAILSTSKEPAFSTVSFHSHGPR